MSSTSGMTHDSVRTDLKRAFLSTGPGSHDDRAANMILQQLRILSDRLNLLGVLKVIYLGDSEEDSSLPIAAYKLIERIVALEVQPDEAEKELENMIRSFEKMFSEMGINPVSSTAVFFNIRGIARE